MAHVEIPFSTSGPVTLEEGKSKSGHAMSGWPHSPKCLLLLVAVTKKYFNLFMWS